MPYNGAGGTNEHGNWVHTRQNGKYLFPVKAMSRVFRGKFMEQFRCFMADGGMDIDEELHTDLYRNEWVVYLPAGRQVPNARLEEPHR